MSEPTKSTCFTCGHSWPTGRDGSHSCAEILRASNGGLLELLEQHQELDRLQGNHMQDLERDLILARTQLIGRDDEIQKLRTQVKALSKNLPEVIPPPAQPQEQK